MTLLRITDNDPYGDQRKNTVTYTVYRGATDLFVQQQIRNVSGRYITVDDSASDADIHDALKRMHPRIKRVNA